MTIKHIVVVGAGPSGLLLALLLAQRGISVEVLEAGDTVDQSPRAMVLGTVATTMLERAGVLEGIRDEAQQMRSMSWRDINGKELHSETTDGYLLHPVHMLCEELMRYVEALPNARVCMGHRAWAVGQDVDQAWVDVVTESGKKRLHADFVVGCDGASSVVRESFLDDDDYRSKAVSDELVVADVRYDMTKYDWSDVQWIVDPDDWGMVANVSRRESVWRVVSNVGDCKTAGELEDMMPTKMRRILPGCPPPEDFEILHVNPFRASQGCKKYMRDGRLLLAGDAAHLCNPIGGYGVTGGLADVGSLVDCLYGIHDGQADTDILDKYSEVRLSVYKEFIEPMATARIRCISTEAGTDSNSAEKDGTLLAANWSPQMFWHEAEALLRDMTQHYSARLDPIALTGLVKGVL